MAKKTSDHSATTAAHADTFQNTMATTCREVAEYFTVEDNAVNNEDSEYVAHYLDDIIKVIAITTETDVDQGITDERTSRKVAIATAVIVVQ